MLNRPQTVALQVLGILMVIPGLLHVPLPQADFHIIRHHHGVGEVCPHHDHLLRWHPQADESEDVAVLHWHWLLPRFLDMNADDAGPALHAHQVDSLQPEWNVDQAALSSEVRAHAWASSELATWLDLALIGAARIDSIMPDAPNFRTSARQAAHDPSSATALSQLVRWNC